MVQDPRGPQNIEPEVFETLWRLYRRGERDLLEGGVPTTKLAAELGRTRDTTHDVLSRLQEQGVVERVEGANPDDYRARKSWAPTALLDGGESA